MKKLLLLSALLIFACSPFCSYSQNAFVNIDNINKNRYNVLIVGGGGGGDTAIAGIYSLIIDANNFIMGAGNSRDHILNYMLGNQR